MTITKENSKIDDVRYKLITADGKITYEDFMTLTDMQKFVGGYIEYCNNMIVNDEGQMSHMKLPINKLCPRFVGNVIVDRKHKKYI